MTVLRTSNDSLIERQRCKPIWLIFVITKGLFGFTVYFVVMNGFLLNYERFTLLLRMDCLALRFTLSLWTILLCHYKGIVWFYGLRNYSDRAVWCCDVLCHYEGINWFYGILALSLRTDYLILRSRVALLDPGSVSFYSPLKILISASVWLTSTWLCKPAHLPEGSIDSLRFTNMHQSTTAMNCVQGEHKQWRSSVYLETTREGQVREQTMTTFCIYRNYAHDRQVREQTNDGRHYYYLETIHEGQVREQTITIIIIPRNYTQRTSQRTNNNDHLYN